MLGAIVGPTLIAFTMRLVLNRGLSWFANEYSPILLYGPAAFLGALVSQKFIPALGADAEHTLFGSVVLLQGVAALGIQLLHRSFYGIIPYTFWEDRRARFVSCSATITKPRQHMKNISGIEVRWMRSIASSSLTRLAV